MAVIATWDGVSIDPDALENYGWFNSTIVVNSVTYKVFYGHMVAHLREANSIVVDASSAKDDAETAADTATTQAGIATTAAGTAGGHANTAGDAASAAATSAADAALSAGSVARRYLTVAGTDTLTSSATPTLTAYDTGLTVRFVVANTNTGAVTLNIDSLGAQAVTDLGAVALTADALEAGTLVEATYDGVQFRARTPAAGVPASILTPTNVAPADEATDEGAFGAAIVLTGSPIYSLYGQPKVAGQWQVSSTDDFAAPEIDTGEVAGVDVFYTISDPAGDLAVSTLYYWRLRYKVADGEWSAWSAPTTFTTAASLTLAVGDPFEGGYYAGLIVDNGTTYRLVVAPKSSGESSTISYKNSNDGTIAACITLTNGPAATAAMVAAGNSTVYPAAHFANNLSIGGFGDWYLPARDELEIAYRAFKPTTTNNATGDRSKSSYTYTNGGNSDDVSGDDHGVNRHSDPAGSAYTTGPNVPPQTAVAAFQTGQSEAFEAAIYWSATEYSTTAAWYQDFSSGYQDKSAKTGTYRVRAVRRSPL